MVDQPRGCLHFVIVVFPDHTHFLLFPQTFVDIFNIFNKTHKRMVLAFLYLKIVGFIGADRDDQAKLTRADLTQADLTQG